MHIISQKRTGHPVLFYDINSQNSLNPICYEKAAMQLTNPNIFIRPSKAKISCALKCKFSIVPFN